MIVEKVLFVICVCVVVRKVKDLIRRKLLFDVLGFVSKLVDCCSKDFEKLEIYIVEGDFVGGFVK